MRDSLIRALRDRFRQWCIARGLYHPERNDELLNGDLRPIKGLILWMGSFFDRLAIAVAASGILFAVLKVAAVQPFTHMTWWRALSPLWLGVPLTLLITVAAAVVTAILVGIVLASSQDDDDDDHGGGHYSKHLA